MRTRMARNDPSRGDSAKRRPTLLASGGSDAGALLAGQQRTAEALAAATQRLISGMQEISKHQLLLQIALFQQAFVDLLSLIQAANPNGAPEQVAQTAQTAMEGTMEGTMKAMRNTVDAACRCGADALAAFQDRIGGGEDAGSHAPCRSEQRGRQESKSFSRSVAPGERIGPALPME